MTEPRSPNSNAYQGGGHFEFSSEKNWGVEQDDCRIFDSIDIPHLADSVASVPFNLRHNIPDELFTIEQLEEFEVEASLALSRHTFQCNSKLKDKTVASTSAGRSQKPETNKLMNLILDNFSSSEEKVLDSETQSHGQLDAILGNMKPLINVLQDEMNMFHNTETGETDSKPFECKIKPVTRDSEIEVTNDTGHWLDSMLNSVE